jgi:hypothetical protein
VDLCAEVVGVVMSDENNRSLVSTHDAASAQQPAEASAQPSADQVTSLLNSLAQKSKIGRASRRFTEEEARLLTDIVTCRHDERCKGQGQRNGS